MPDRPPYRPPSTRAVLIAALVLAAMYAGALLETCYRQRQEESRDVAR